MTQTPLHAGGELLMTLYEQVQRERLADQIVEDIYNPPIHKTVLLVDLRSRARRFGGRCGVRVQKPNTPVSADAVLRASQIVRPSKDRGS